SPIAHAFRATTASMTGHLESDLKLTESALDDIRQAKFRLRDNSFVRFTSAYGHMFAADLYGKAGLLEKQKAALAEAKDDVDFLANLPVSLYVHGRVSFYTKIKDDDTHLNNLATTLP